MPRKLLLCLLALLLIVWQWPAPAPDQPRLNVFPVYVHSLTELGAVVAALMVFFVAWHAGRSSQPRNITLLACGFLSVGLLDVGHLFGYKGMPDFFTQSGVEKGLQFWLAARYAAAWTLLFVAVRPQSVTVTPRQRWGMLGLALIYTAVMYAINLLVPTWWPTTFIEGQGLTPFKIVAEYGVIVLALSAAFFLCRQGPVEAGYSTRDLCTAALITALSELCLTLYANVTDVFMLLGHLYKILAYFFIYRAVFVTSIREPYRRLQIEVNERREAEQRAAFLAYHDVLTSLPNRVLARDRLSQAVADARRHDTQVAMVFLDLDHFKNINDSLGHAAGDLLLRTVAERLTQNVREADTVSRQGGDEFLLILKDVHGPDHVGEIVSKLIDALTRPMMIEDHELVTSASAGIAMFPGDGGEFDVLMQRADTAMYRAKEEGRNTWRFYNDAMNAESLERLSIRNGLRQALEQGQFLLHYQPQVNLTSGALVGVEALLRWQHPERGLVSPARFIPVAEESGLIVPIGEWALHEACRQAAHWRAQGFGDLSMAVNLSAVQFKRGNVEQVVAEALQRSGLPPTLLELELTESVLISDPDAVQSRLLRLKELGIKLAIDDFGTGYSSLSYLKRFSVDKLKIDQSFVQDLVRRPDEVAIVRAIIQMATGLGLKTIAEGVETPEMMTQLLALGCEEAQGYHIARPMAAQAFEQWWHARQHAAPTPEGEVQAAS